MNKNDVKKIIVVIVLLLIVLITLTRVNFLDYERPISYGQINQITFKNFRGLEFFQSSLYGNKHFAYVKTSIDYEFEKDSIKVEAFFHPSSSYVYNQNTYSEDLLRHEMYHFRITELYARIAKKRITELKVISGEEADDLIAEIKMEENDYQRRYDDDTFHNYVLSEQKKYEKNIDSLLSLHQNFKNPKVYINEK